MYWYCPDLRVLDGMWAGRWPQARVTGARFTEREAKTVFVFSNMSVVRASGGNHARAPASLTRVIFSWHCDDLTPRS
jgi:hypothetical protein